MPTNDLFVAEEPQPIKLPKQGSPPQPPPQTLDSSGSDASLFAAPPTMPSPGTPPTGSTVPVPSTTTGSSTPSPESTDFATQASNAQAVTADQTVQGQLASLFENRDVNPLFQFAEGQAMQYANSRGLLNSNMAAEAGAQAVFANALPIASQDANTFAASARQAQSHLENMTQLAMQGDINSRLQLEQFGYNFQLNEQQNFHNMQLAAFQGDIQAQLALQQFGFDTELMSQDFGYRLTLQQNELANALSLMGAEQTNVLEQMSLQHTQTLEQIEANGTVQGELVDQQFTLNLQQNYLAATENRTLQFSQEVQTIYSTEGLTPEQQQFAVQAAQNRYYADLSNMMAFYSQSPYWDPGWGMPPAVLSSTSGGSSGAVPTPTAPPIAGPPGAITR